MKIQRLEKNLYQLFRSVLGCCDTNCGINRTFKIWLFGKLKSFINSSMGILFAQFLHIMLVILCKQSICHNTYLKKSHRCNLEKLRHFLPGCTQYFLRKKLSIHWIFFQRKLSMCASLYVNLRLGLQKHLPFLQKTICFGQNFVTFQLKQKTGKITFALNFFIVICK